MEVILIVALSLFVATSDGEVFSSKDNSKSQEVEVIVIQPEPVEPEPVEPEPVQTETAEPEEVQQEETSESNINEEGTNWLNIILYILGAILVIGTGIYFLARKQTITPLSAAGSPRQEFVQRKITEPQVQEQPQEETQSEPQVQEQPQEETQSSENTEDDSSENNNK